MGRGHRRLWAAAVGILLVGATLAGWIRCRAARPAMSACERAVRGGDQRRGVELCLESFARTGNEDDLSWAAQAHMYLGELDEAERYARRLLAGPLAGEGHRILGYVMLQRGSGDQAILHARAALAAHQRTGAQARQTSAAVILAQAAWKLGDFTASLEAADLALGLARRLNDPRNEVAAHLARANALRRMGDTRGAVAALTRASERAADPCDRAWSHLKMALCEWDLAQEGRAGLELSKAAQANERCRSKAISSSIAIIEAWLLRWRDPDAARTRLDEIERSEGALLETLLLRGYLAADRGELAAAAQDLARAEAMDPPDVDWPWVIARAHAELAELRGGPFDDLLAEYHYRRATAMVAALRSTARARSAYLVSSHRGPADGLIGLLARHGRWREVLDVLLELDASDMLRATAADVRMLDAPPDLIPPPPGAIAPPPATAGDVLAAWRARELVIVAAPSRRELAPGGERAYRVRIAAGEITGEDVGDASAVRRWAEDLFADPGDRDAARELGRRIAPAGPAGDTLHVLAVGSLGKVPLAALRDGGGVPIIAGRPLARVLGLRASGPEAGGAGPPVILADPRGDLRGAAAEGAMVAAALGAGARVAGARPPLLATRARLWAARDAEVLHIAAHVAERGRWRALRLADGEVDPAEMVRRRLAPRLAVLAGCGSAAATDPEGWGSIAAALLESGTAAVIATDRSIGDAASLAVMRDFYAQPDWRADPARALARVQRALDARAATCRDEACRPRAWAAFSVLHRPPVVAAPAAPGGSP